jgi:hypothetical protein
MNIKAQRFASVAAPLFATLLAATPRPVAAQQTLDTFLGALAQNCSGVWSDTNCWLETTSSGVAMVPPSAGDAVEIEGAGTLDTDTPALLAVDIGSGIAGAQLSQGNGVLNTAVLNVGVINTAAGAYVLSGGTINVTGTNGAGESIFGGSFSQSGGDNNAGPALLINGSGATSPTYNISGGTLTAAGVSVGSNEAGSFTQSGGTATISGPLTLGNQAGASGSYTLSGTGQLSIDDAQYGLTIGANGAGTFSQAGTSSVSVTGPLALGGAAGANGTYQLTGGDLTVDGDEAVGGDGTGSFTQGGGTNTTTGTLVLGKGTGSSGTYTMTGGSLMADAETVGSGGLGTFMQSGGINEITTDLIVGEMASFTANSYQLSGTATLKADNETIGSLGAGTFSQSGGATNTIGAALTIGDQANSTGTYYLNGGTLQSATLVVGSAGTGTFNQAAGTMFTVNGDVTVGGDALGSNGSGTYNMTGGTLNAASVTVGGYGSGTFAEAGGSLTMQGTLTLGDKTSGRGNFILSGSATLNALQETIGGNGLGTFNQLGGSNAVNSAGLSIGDQGGSHGTYTLSGGNLVASGVTVGNLGTGTFTQSGGMSNVTGALIVADQLSSMGTYNMSGGNLYAFSMQIGANDLALNGLDTNQNTFTQTGGAVALGGAGPGALSVGDAAGNNGTYELQNTATLSAVTETVGNGGSGAFGQSGGTNTVSGGLSLGAKTGAAGTYTLSGGQLSAASETVGAAGTGQFTQSGGTNTVAGSLTIGTTGTYNLSGGTLSTGSTVNGGQFNVTGPTGGGALAEVLGGPFTNNGTVKVTNASVTFNGAFTNNGVLNADPSTLTFASLAVGASGYLLAGAGNVFAITGSFINASTQNTLWNTSLAALLFSGTSVTAQLGSTDGGAGGAANNFAWGSVELSNGTALTISGAHQALYTGLFLLDGGLAQLSGLASADNIYYNPALAGNAYLGDQSYALTGGGFLLPGVAAVPEPASSVLLAAGLAVLGVFVRGRSKSSRAGSVATVADPNTFKGVLSQDQLKALAKIAISRL